MYVSRERDLSFCDRSLEWQIAWSEEEISRSVGLGLFCCEMSGFTNERSKSFFTRISSDRI